MLAVAFGAVGTGPPAFAGDGFPLLAASRLVALETTAVSGDWGVVITREEYGGHYPSADFTDDPDSVRARLDIGAVPESLANTTQGGAGRADARSTISGGFRLNLPGHTVPAVAFDALRHSVACDLSGSVTWENKLNGGPGYDDRTVTVFGTDFAVPLAGAVSAALDLPGTGEPAMVEIVADVPDDAPGTGRVATTISVSTARTEIFTLVLGDVAVDCGPSARAGDAPAPARPVNVMAVPGPGRDPKGISGLPVTTTALGSLVMAGAGTLGGAALLRFGRTRSSPGASGAAPTA
ncbi:hypothetical protein Nans01_05390 [Nocardiopsis ansamitocini]|uniref:Uncharacterized protein n=1 Tax=Nocardiopsis ansamitocini TaxID=1670832 RepID=A0A9W6UHB9_9ACTN|nr:hypothetical protein Nans01_05390 [Nocardiopsis ansamitocini]